MAEGILRHRLHGIGRNDITVSSMGIHGQDGKSATNEGVAVCAENSIDISGHLARPLHFDELKSAGLIFVMEPVQKEYIRTFVPSIEERLSLFAVWPAEPQNKKSSTIPDPVGGSLADYRKTFTLISSHMERILPFLLAQMP
ncbi:MAG: hypothetical protein MUF22_06940 [Chitinispirillaceae bacterium]|jgi:protein-tyrosine-phosphatase|nr:hypothetical protein [Chitinispirillaceae bacterium]